MKLRTNYTLLAVVLSFITFCKCNFEDHGLLGVEKNLAGNATAALSSPNVLYSNEAFFKFSDASQNDHFALVLRGDDLETAKAYFTITNNSGKVLFADTFPSEALINYAILPESEPMNEDGKELYIKKRVTEFFNPKQFSFPAIKDPSEFEPQYSALPVWQAIANDPTAVGFHYMLYEETGKSIAFDKTRHKTVTYFSCC